MNPPSADDTRKIHAQYCALTGMDIPYCMELHFRWECWLAAGFTEPDLAAVVRYIKGRIRQGRREKESLLLRNLIRTRDSFSEELAIARAETRNTFVDTPRKQVLRSTGRPTEPDKPALSAREIMERDAKVAELIRQCKEAVK